LTQKLKPPKGSKNQGMSTGVRENITEMLIKQKGMSSFAHMVEEGFIPGDQTLSTKKKVMEKWGFRNRYDTVRFLFDISIALTDFANHQVYCNSATGLVLLNFSQGISFKSSVLKSLPRGTFPAAVIVAGNNLVDYIETVSKRKTPLAVNIFNRLHATGHQGHPGAPAG
jgi:hypothetical protein